MNEKQIQKDVDLMIAEQDLPQRADLKVLKWSPFENWQEEDINAWFDHLHWFMGKDHALLHSLPVQVAEPNFWPEPDNANSFAFGSMDFHRLRGEFNKYQYRLKKVFERVKDLAQTFSILSHESGKKNIQIRYEKLLYSEFRHKVIKLAKTYHKYRNYMDYNVVRERISEQNRYLVTCKTVWNKHAFEE